MPFQSSVPRFVRPTATRETDISQWSEADVAAIRDQLDRVLESESFVSGERQCRFLRYVVDAALEGRADRASQFAIGMDVFDRDKSFDPTVDSIVRVEAGRIRSKLAEYYNGIGKEDDILIDLPKGGYAAVIQIRRSKETSETASDRPHDPYKKVAAFLLASALVVAVVSGWLIWRQVSDRTSRPSNLIDPAKPSEAVGKPAIAVLPFDNMSADPKQEYFSDGITEDIITDLSIFSGLTVIARHSTFVYKDRQVSIQKVGKELGVHYVLEGSVRRNGDRLRITAQLIDATTDHHIWANRYDRKLGDIFSIQDDVSAKIVSALKVALTDREKTRRARHNTSSVRAYDLYLRGKEQFYRFDAESVRRSIDFFSQAIRIDPAFAEAYAWKSRALVYSFITGFNETKDEIVDQALELARKATELDALLPMAHANLAWALRWDRRIEMAAETVAHAIALDPNYADAFLWKSLVLSTARNGKGSVLAIEQAFRLNPNYGVTYIFALGRAYFALGDLENARKQFERGIERNPNFLPNHLYRMFAAEASGDTETAERIRNALSLSHPRFEQSASYRYYDLEWR